MPANRLHHRSARHQFRPASPLASKYFVSIASMPAHENPDHGFLTESTFRRRLQLEQRRTERSRRPFVLVIVQSASLLKPGQKHGTCEQVMSLLSTSIRETDIHGWYEDEFAIGLIFTEIGAGTGYSVGNALVNKLQGILAGQLTAHQMAHFRFSFYVFPDDWDRDGGALATVLYPDTARSRRPSQVLKRSIDIAGSLAALILASPVFFVIAVLVKITSKGPILFRQDRVGKYGRKFTFLKFRSMYVNNDHDIHREYVRKLIAGSAGDDHGRQQKVYKLTNDPRITPMGTFLRKTSLDELPQFLNVLLGDMSLVGPRPPIPYEVESYDIWHRRRLLMVKPGITGLWQVSGRSRTTFDEMVRLDLQYAKSWSLWLDVKILLQTPGAVVAGDGAY